MRAIHVIFVRRKECMCGRVKVLNPQKNFGAQICNQLKKRLVPQFANPQSATFAESPEIEQII
jgi:hypothetical protein